jgi:xanthine/CO dehydrogenase XdhC/CoxF family maturation factor
MSEALDVLAAFGEAVDAGRPVVLATIVRAKGSTPRGVGSRMAIEPESAVGTVGGGCGEAEVIAEARAALEAGRPRVVRVDLTDDLYSWSPAVCGGVFDVLLEPWTPGEPAAGDPR